MKKALLTIGTAASSIMLAAAQITGTITIGNGAQQGQVNGGAILSLLALAQEIVSRLVPFAIGAAVLAFFWFLILFIVKSSDATARKGYIQGMGYSVLALFVMVSIWGIIGLLGSIVGVNQGGTIPIPGVPRPS